MSEPVSFVRGSAQQECFGVGLGTRKQGAGPRFCIIGAGPAGLTAALELKRLGYSQVTVLEKQAEGVGGKCHTVLEQGELLDVGAVYVLPHYPTVRRLAAQAGVRLYPAQRIVHIGEDGRQRPFGVPSERWSLAQKAAEYLRLGALLARHHEVFSRSLGELEADALGELVLPFREWLRRHRLEHFHEVAYPMMRSFGFGFEEQDIPAAYIFKVLPQLTRGGNWLSLWNVSSVALWQIEEGFGEMWRRLAASLDVHVGVEVQRVERSERGGTVRSSAGTFEFDYLVLACALPGTLDFLDASSEERELFGRIRSFPVWQVAARAEGLPEAFIVDSAQRFSEVGRTMLALRYRPRSDSYYFFGYGNEHLGEDALLAQLHEEVRTLGGRLSGPARLSRWSYFPHFGVEDLRQGGPARLHALQGQRSTYYVGEIVSNLGVESVVTHAERLVRRWLHPARR